VQAVASNTAPAGSDGSVNGTEDTVYTFTTGDFGFSDVDGHALLRVWIDTLPASGTLLWRGTPFAAGNYVSAVDIDNGEFTYVPAADANGTAVASFTFRVWDDGGTEGGGIDTDPTPRTLTIDLAAVNDAPAHTLPGVQVTPLNTQLVMSGVNAIAVGDVDSATLQVTLTASNGTLTLASVAGLGFTVGDGTADASMSLQRQPGRAEHRAGRPALHARRRLPGPGQHRHHQQRRHAQPRGQRLRGGGRPALPAGRGRLRRHAGRPCAGRLAHQRVRQRHHRGGRRQQRRRRRAAAL
jgi:hypothetical protein